MVVEIRFAMIKLTDKLMGYRMVLLEVDKGYIYFQFPFKAHILCFSLNEGHSKKTNKKVFISDCLFHP